MSAASQNARVLARLRRGPLTPLSAFRELGVFRLAARIYDLRGVGHDIRAVAQRRNPHYATYHLVKEAKR